MGSAVRFSYILVHIHIKTKTDPQALGSVLGLPCVFRIFWYKFMSRPKPTQNHPYGRSPLPRSDYDSLGVGGRGKQGPSVEKPYGRAVSPPAPEERPCLSMGRCLGRRRPPPDRDIFRPRPAACDYMLATAALDGLLRTSAANLFTDYDNFPAVLLVRPPRYQEGATCA